MTTIAANELKQRGVSVLSEALDENAEATITVRGKRRYVVMTTEQYDSLRMYELEAALAEARADVSAGRYRECTVAEHVSEVENAI